MSVVAGTLEIQMRAELAKLSSDMTQAKGIVSSAMRDIERAVGQLTGALAGLGLPLTAAGLAFLGKQAIDAADGLNDLSKSTGLAVEKLAGLRLAAKQSGGDLDGIANSINKLSVNIGKNAEKFTALGITAKDPLEAFKQFADIFTKIENPQLRAALGAEALGKSWASAAPLLAEGGQKIGEMVEKGEKLSGMTKELAEQSDAFNDKLVELGGNGGMVNGMLAQMLPLLNAAADGLLSLRDGGGGAGSMLGTVLTEALRVVIVLAGNVGFVLRGIGNEIGGIAAQVAAVMTGDFARALDIRRMMIADAEAARAKFDAWEASIMAVGTATGKTTAATKEMSEAEFDAATAMFLSKRAAEAKANAFMKLKEAAEKAARAQKELGDANAHVVTEEKHRIEMAKIANAEMQKAIDLEEQLRQSKEGTIKSFREAVEQMEFEVTLLGKTNAEREVSIRLRELEKAGIDTSTVSVAAYADRIRAAYAAQEDFRAGQEAMRSQVSVWTDLSRAAGDFFADLVMNGKSAFDNLREWAKRFLAELLSIFAQKWILQLGASLAGGSTGGALSSTAGQIGQGTLTGAASSWLGNTLMGTGTIGTALGQTGIMQFYGGMSGAIQGPGLTGAAGLGQQTAGMASGYAGALGIIGIIIAAGLWAMDLYKSGWRDTGDAGTNMWQTGGFSGIQQVDNKLLKLLGFSDRDAFTMSGGPIISRLFGYKARQNDAYGIRGTFGGGGITGENWQDWSQQGGLFRSDRRGTDVSPFSAEQQAFLDKVFKGIGDTVGGFGALMGVDTKALFANYSKAFDFQLNENGDPLSDEALQKLFGDYFGAILQEQVAATLTEGGNTELAEYVKALKGSGEEITAWIVELLGVMQALKQVDILGLKAEDLMKFKQDGETLTQTFQRVAGAWAQFQDLFYTDAEKIANVTSQVSAVFADLGIAMPTSNEEFRKLVESLDLTTESGRKMFTALMGVAPAFNAITNAATAAVTRFNALATTLSPSFGSANARSVLEARARAWMGLTPANGEAGGWTVGSTIDNIGRMVREGRIGEALTYAQSLGGNAVTVLNDMLEAYIAWTTAMQNANGPVNDVGRGITGLGDAAERAAAQMQGAKDSLWAYLQGLLVNPSLSPLDPMQQLEVAKRQFLEQAALARGGDVGAMSGLSGFIDTILQLGRGAFASGSGYVDLFNWVTGVAGDLARPGGAQDLQRLANEQLTIQTGELREIKALLMDIRDKGDSNAEYVADASLTSGETVAQSVKSATLETARK